MDTLTVKERSARMKLIKNKDTKPELRVRKLLHGAGYRFRLHRKDLPGKPDLVFPSRKKVIFVHGCFWHAHPDPDCRKARIPKTRQDFWKEKFRQNSDRDERNMDALSKIGWEALVLWECQLKDNEAILSKAREFLDEVD